MPWKYAATGTMGVLVVTGCFWPFVDGPARSGIAVAGAIALTVQIAAFWLLVRFRDEWTRFLVVWVGGVLLRMAVVGVVAAVAFRSGIAGAVPLLLALAGFFFGLLLLEPVYFRRGNEGLEAR